MCAYVCICLSKRCESASCRRRLRAKLSILQLYVHILHSHVHTLISLPAPNYFVKSFTKCMPGSILQQNVWYLKRTVWNLLSSICVFIWIRLNLHKQYRQTQDKFWITTTLSHSDRVKQIGWFRAVFILSIMGQIVADTKMFICLCIMTFDSTSNSLEAAKILVKYMSHKKRMSKLMHVKTLGGEESLMKAWNNLWKSDDFLVSSLARKYRKTYNIRDEYYMSKLKNTTFMQHKIWINLCVDPRCFVIIMKYFLNLGKIVLSLQLELSHFLLPGVVVVVSLSMQLNLRAQMYLDHEGNHIGDISPNWA